MTDAEFASPEAAAERMRAWRDQLDTDARAWFERNGHPTPDPLWAPDEDVPCTFGCGTDLRGPDGKQLHLLLADIDELLAPPKQSADEVIKYIADQFSRHKYGYVVSRDSRAYVHAHDAAASLLELLNAQGFVICERPAHHAPA